MDGNLHHLENRMAEYDYAERLRFQGLSDDQIREMEESQEQVQAEHERELDNRYWLLQHEEL